ncbi:hypothetical protein D3C77_682990 [compost metagenome]
MPAGSPGVRAKRRQDMMDTRKASGCRPAWIDVRAQWRALTDGARLLQNPLSLIGGEGPGER